MADGDGLRQPASAAKSLGDIVGDVSQKSSLLVREEIALAKAEVAEKAKRFGAGAAAGGAAGIFVVLALILFFVAVAFFFAEVVLNGIVWLGFLITVGILLLLAVLVGLIAFRLVRRALPPTPQMAIDEAKRTRTAIEEARR